MTGKFLFHPEYFRGSPVVWSVAQHFKERVIAVGSLVVPYFPPNPKKNPLQGARSIFLTKSYSGMLQDPGRFDYQLYFQEEGVAEAEFEKDVKYSMNCLVR